MSLDPCDRALWARILAMDETSHEYFAHREDMPGAILFTNSQSPTFNLARSQAAQPPISMRDSGSFPSSPCATTCCASRGVAAPP